MGGGGSKPAPNSGGDGGDDTDASELARLRREVQDLRRQLSATKAGSHDKEAQLRASEGASRVPTDHEAHEAHARSIHAEHDHHERRLKAKLDEQQRASRKSLNSRLAARLKVKQQKALQKVPIFRSLGDDIISALVDKMEYQKFDPGSVLCAQGDEANHFYIIVHGVCHVIVNKDKTIEVDQSGDTTEVADREVEVGILRDGHVRIECFR